MLNLQFTKNIQTQFLNAQFQQIGTSPKSPEYERVFHRYMTTLGTNRIGKYILNSNNESMQSKWTLKDSTHPRAAMVERSVRLKHVFGSVFVFGQHFTQMKTFRVRICRYIERKTPGFTETLQWAVQFIILNQERGNFFRRQTFYPIPFEVSKVDMPIAEKSSLLSSPKSLRQKRHRNENDNTKNHLNRETKNKNFNLSQTVIKTGQMQSVCLICSVPVRIQL